VPLGVGLSHLTPSSRLELSAARRSGGTYSVASAIRKRSLGFAAPSTSLGAGWRLRSG